MLNVQSIRPGAVNILIGPNGSGKSRLLRKLCSDFLLNGESVIGIAPTIYDRFKRMPKGRFKFFGARHGWRSATRVIRSCLARASKGDLRVLKNLTRALDYTKFEPRIGIGLSKIDMSNWPAMARQLPMTEAEDLYSALMKWRSQFNQGGIVRLTLEEYSVAELASMTFAILARRADLLFRNKVTSRLEFFLYREGKGIPLLEACSGEINFITAVAYISNEISKNAVIAIDEPETSLHPAWQQSYISTLLDLFYQYEPRILISTHSPIIISGAEASRGQVIENKTSVYEVKNGREYMFDYENLSLEEMYGRLFGLITPRNHYLSQQAVTMMNELNSGKRSLDEVVGELQSLRAKSYDESQRAVIGKIEEMAHSLASMKQGRGA